MFVKMFVKNYCFVLIFVFMSGASLPLYSQMCKYLWRVRSVNACVNMEFPVNGPM